MKVNITDLLDDFTPDQELDLLEDNKKSVNLNSVKRTVSKTIARSKGGLLMNFNLKNKIVAACLGGITILSLGGATVNAATDGALFNSIKVIFFNEDGTKGEVNLINSYTDENGNKVSEYSRADGDEVLFSVTESEDGTTTSIETDDTENGNVSGSVCGSISQTSDGDQQVEEKQIIVSENDKPTSSSEGFGIDTGKYVDYETGIYEETNSDGIEYVIEVSEDGSVSIQEKE